MEGSRFAFAAGALVDANAPTRCDVGRFYTLWRRTMLTAEAAVALAPAGK
jgi:hypothetical protein